MKQLSDSRSSVERQARTLLSTLTGEQPRTWRDLDAPGAQLPPGKRPDFIGEDSRGVEYVFEVTRLLTPELRRLEDFAKRRIAAPLDGRLPGSYVLWISMDGMSKTGMPPIDAKRILDQVEAQLARGALVDRFEPLPGYRVEKFNSGGHSLVPMVLAKDLPYELAPNDPLAAEPQQEFESIVREASSKFQSYAGRHILLVDVSQTGLDVELHVMRPGGKPGLMATWVANLPPEVANVHEIYFEPGIRVWAAPEPGEDPDSPPRRIRAGTRFADEQRGFYVQLRPLPVRLR